jgi:small nuclear ribonucleoprotein (snRNP)-like protein
MNNRSRLYVIGLNQYHLIEIYEHSLYTPNDIILAINKVVHGIMHMYDATQFLSLEDAQKILQEIKDNRNSIHFVRETVLESIIDGNELDVDNLHIYEIDMRITREVT